MAVFPDDIAVELGRTAPATSEPAYAQWEQWIADALMLIAARLGDLAQLDQGHLDYVVRQAVVAHIRRPDSATQVSISVDDASTQRTYRSSKGRVEILDEWWDLLSPPNRSSGAWSIRPHADYSPHVPWCSLLMGATYCSCGVDIAGVPIFEGGAE